MNESSRYTSGKTALITGASSGIGRATALRLAKAGVTIAGAGRNQDGLEETGTMISDVNGTFFPIQTELSQAGAMEAAVEQTISELGQIDILINNAGVMYLHTPGFTKRDRWTQLLQINLLSAIEGCEAAIKHMRKRSASGRIVNNHQWHRGYLEAGSMGPPNLVWKNILMNCANLWSLIIFAPSRLYPAVFPLIWAAIWLPKNWLHSSRICETN